MALTSPSDPAASFCCCCNYFFAVVFSEAAPRPPRRARRSRDTAPPARGGQGRAGQGRPGLHLLRSAPAAFPARPAPRGHGERCGKAECPRPGRPGAAAPPAVPEQGPAVPGPAGPSHAATPANSGRSQRPVPTHGYKLPLGSHHLYSSLIFFPPNFFPNFGLPKSPPCTPLREAGPSPRCVPPLPGRVPSRALRAVPAPGQALCDTRGSRAPVLEPSRASSGGQGPLCSGVPARNYHPFPDPEQQLRRGLTFQREPAAGIVLPGPGAHHPGDSSGQSCHRGGGGRQGYIQVRADLGETRAVSGPRRIRSAPGGGGGCRRGAGRRQRRRCPFVSDPRCPAPGGQGRAGPRGAAGRARGRWRCPRGCGERRPRARAHLSAPSPAAAPPRLATAVRPGRAAPADWASGGSAQRPARPERRRPHRTGPDRHRAGI